MKQLSINIILLLFIFSCTTNSGKQAENESDLSETFQKLKKIPEDSLQFYTYKVKPINVARKSSEFNTLNDFPEKWVGLSKNSIGLFIYHKGKGYYNDLIIKDGTLTNGGYGEHVSWLIRDFKKIDDNKYYFSLGSDTINGVYARSTIEILGQDTLLAIQTTQIFEAVTDKTEKLLGEYSGLYIPDFQQHLFPHIDEPNKQSPDSRIPIEQIDLEKIKRKNLKRREIMSVIFYKLIKRHYLSQR